MRVWSNRLGTWRQCRAERVWYAASRHATRGRGHIGSGTTPERAKRKLASRVASGNTGRWARWMTR